MLSDGCLVIVSLEVFSLSLIPFHFFDLHCSLAENFYRASYSLVYFFFIQKLLIADYPESRPEGQYSRKIGLILFTVFLLW